MWQFLLAAAITGCGLLTKRFLIDLDHHKPSTLEQENNGVVVVLRKEEEEEEEFVDPVKGEVLISSLGVSSRGSNEICDSELQNLVIQDQKEGIFRFSSLDRGDGSESRFSSKGSSLKKVGLRRRNVESGTNRKLSFIEGDDEVKEQKKKRRKFTVCLKRKHTSKKTFRKSGSSSSTGDTFFGYGLGLGLMYMVSAGKAEIEKINEVVEETTKVVHDLKSKLRKRKLSRDLQNQAEIRIGECPKETLSENKQWPGKNSYPEGARRDVTDVLCVLSTDGGESASSVLTEESELGELKVDQLQAELESELLKLPTENVKVQVSANSFPAPHKSLCTDSKPFLFNEVPPSELDTELCNLLIERQESQILELQSNLYSSQLKLHEKESELQRLKDVVHRLSDFSLETLSDSETEDGEVINVKNSKSNLLVSEPKSLLYGKKRVMEFESCEGCWSNSNAVDLLHETGFHQCDVSIEGVNKK